MFILKHILQYSNDGIQVDKEIVLNEDKDSLEGIHELIEYVYDLKVLKKCENSYYGDWLKVEVNNYPYNRLFIKIEENKVLNCDEVSLK